MSDNRYRQWLDKTAGADSYVHISGDSWNDDDVVNCWKLKLADCDRSSQIYFEIDEREIAFAKLEVLESAIVFLRKRLEEWKPPSKV